METGEKLEIRLPARLEIFSEVRERINEFCDRHSILDIFRDRLILMLEELFTNVVEHSEKATDVEVLVILQQNVLAIEFADNGEEFNLFAEDISSVNNDFEFRPVGKLGLPLIRALTKSGEYNREGNWNRLILHMPLEG